MKNELKIVLLFLIFLISRQNTSAIIPDHLTLDSIMYIFKQTHISLDEKYSYIHKMNHLSLDDQIEINSQILDLLKKEKEGDRARLVTVFAMLDNLYARTKQNEKRKININSAIPYINKTTNVDALGAWYYRLGNYFGDNDDMEKAHENLYKAIDYYEKSETKKMMLSFIYYKLGTEFFQNNDLKSLSKLTSKMLKVKFEGDQRIYYNNIYTFVGKYYSLKADIDSVNHLVYSDSAIYYMEKSIDIFHKYDNPNANPTGALRTLCQNHYSIANILLNRKIVDFNNVEKNIKLGEKYMISTDTSTLIKYHGLKALIYYKNKMYKKAIIEYKAEEQLIVSQKYHPDKDRYLTLYSALASAYEKENNPKEALKYSKMADSVRNVINDIAKFEILKTLETKYETAQKELEIAKLNEEKQKEQFQRTLIISIGLFIIVLLLIAFLYNRIKRLKKEKEASALSSHMKEKELEFQSTMAQSELNTMQSYLKGLETERERLAKELHDNIANELLSIDLQLKSIKQVPEKTSIQIENLHTEIRNISHELIPPLFKYASLPEIVSDYVSKVNKNNISIELQIEEDLDHISEKQALEIYRIIQEAISNVVKHAEATVVKISLWDSEDFLKLTIEDNGKGFDVNRKHTGIGLQIIKDRVAGLNGIFQIHSLPDSGCKIDISFPIFQSNGDE